MLPYWAPALGTDIPVLGTCTRHGYLSTNCPHWVSGTLVPDRVLGTCTRPPGTRHPHWALDIPVSDTHTRHWAAWYHVHPPGPGHPDTRHWAPQYWALSIPAIRHPLWPAQSGTTGMAVPASSTAGHPVPRGAAPWAPSTGTAWAGSRHLAPVLAPHTSPCPTGHQCPPWHSC